VELKQQRFEFGDLITFRWCPACGLVELQGDTCPGCGEVFSTETVDDCGVYEVTSLGGAGQPFELRRVDD
jgi:hypothetical protein